MKKIYLQLVLSVMVLFTTNLMAIDGTKKLDGVTKGDGTSKGDGTTAVKFDVRGIIFDEETKEGLPGASVMLQDHSNGTVTDIDGRFTIEVIFNDNRSRLEVSYIGYEKKLIDVANNGTEIRIGLRLSQKMANEVVISASRIPERIMESPVTIEKMNSKDVKETSSGNFYDAAGYMKSVDVVSSGIAFKTINIRGFGNTEKPGFVQLVDGMDNQSPGLNYSMGYNIIDLDVDNMEVIPGTASALYGANAFNGLMNITSKNPFKYQGISVMMKTGVNHVDGIDHAPAPLADFQMRFAKAVSKHLAFKVNAEYFKGQDWVASDTRNASPYRTSSSDGSNVDPSYDGLNVYGDEVNTDMRAYGVPAVVARTGYNEKDLMNYNSGYTKVDGAVHYRFNDKVEASYVYKYSSINSVLHSVDRYAFRNFGLNQHKVELTAPNFFVRAYTVGENSGKTYDTRFLAINMNEAWKNSNDWFTDYAYAYAGAIPGVTGGDYTTARDYADIGRPMPGSDRFNQLKDSISKLVGFGKGGASFDERTSFSHAETQYDFTKKVKFMEVLAGASVRYFNLNSNGTLYPDTAGNKLGFNEYGAYTQIGKKMFADKVKLTASIRYDKSMNYEGQYSPRIAAVWNTGKSNFLRASYQTGFRMPTSQDQYMNMDLGFMRVLGGLPSIVNPYDIKGKVFTLESVTEFGNSVTQYINDNPNDSNAAVNGIEASKGKLVAMNYDYVKPERVQSFELGYKGLLCDNNLFYDISAYYTINHDFIGYYNVVRPANGGGHNADSITTAAYSLATETPGVYQLATNLAGDVNTYGVALGLSYNLPRNFIVTGNCTWSKLDKAGYGRTMYNAPVYKTNLGLANRNVYKNVGFSVNWRWADSYKWESLFGDGMLTAANTLDAQVSYKFDKMATTLKMGATNALNNRHTEVHGGGTVGGVYYMSLTYDGIFK